MARAATDLRTGAAARLETEEKAVLRAPRAAIVAEYNNPLRSEGKRTSAGPFNAAANGARHPVVPGGAPNGPTLGC